MKTICLRKSLGTSVIGSNEEALAFQAVATVLETDMIFWVWKYVWSHLGEKHTLRAKSGEKRKTRGQNHGGRCLETIERVIAFLKC